MNLATALILLVSVTDGQKLAAGDPPVVPEPAPSLEATPPPPSAPEPPPAAMPEAPPVPSVPTAMAPSEPQPPLSIYDVRLKVDLPVIGVAAVVGSMRVYLRDRFARRSCPCDPSTLNPIDRGTVGNHSQAALVAADATVYVAIGAPLLGDLLDVGVSRAFTEDLLVVTETLVVDSAVVNIFDFAFARPRPVTYAGDPKFLNSGEGYLSFYAGHVATTFAALSAASYSLGRRHHQYVWPWIVTVLVGGSVAVERVASGSHFPTDVAMGALMGTAMGITIPWLHTRELPVPVTFAPSVAGGPGLALLGRF
ncbi:MAG: phosphoesterase, PA-phosphatase related protein [Myxococcales bacterium]|nr:phosphoesterase, PA-phosphatase related protein [Myxococcales bacterium]